MESCSELIPPAPRLLRLDLVYFWNLPTYELLATTMIGEAAKEPYVGKVAIGCVARNRVARPQWANTYREVLLQKLQFSCFNDGAPTLTTMRQRRKHHEFPECLLAAGEVLSDCVDVTMGADHYCRHDCYPNWRQGFAITLQIGNHIFFDSRKKPS